MSLYRVRTIFTGVEGAPFLSTFLFEQAGGTAQQAATAAGAFWTALAAGMHTSLAWTTEGAVAVINETNGNTESVSATTPVVGAGTAVSDRAPAATQGLVRWRTGIFTGGRELRGRTFLPGVPEDQGSQVPLAAYRTRADNAAAALIADVNTILAIRSSKFDATGLSFAHPVVSGETWTQYAVLRSRRD